MPDKRPAGPVRLFLDANILVSGLVFEGPEHRLLMLADEGRFVGVICKYVRGEVQRVLVEGFGLIADDAAKAVQGLALEVRADPEDGVVLEAEDLLRDPADAPVLAGAWLAKVDALVTGDKGLHAADQTRVRVIHTRDALQLIASSEVPR